MKKLLKFFDKLEDHVREYLSGVPVIYSLIGATAIVVFWDGISRVMDSIEIFDGFWGGMLAIFISVVVLLLTGLLVSFFVGDVIILSGIKHEKKSTDKTREELLEEEKELKDAIKKISHIEHDMEEIKQKIK
ncbi:MAG TPA: hypothetical protein P5056_03640 [Candidatus Paceibacterota bacterium]|nr:hypothetical protein [Candidatus Paceibacterota bacterium]